VHPVFLHIGVILIPAYGALAALGVVAGLFLAQRTARVAGVNPGQVWTLCIVGLFAALVSQRILLIAMNWSDLRLHPSWMLTLAMIHHPLLAAAGTLTGLGAAAIYVRRRHLSLGSTADALAAPLALGLAFEQVGALMAGSGYGTETGVRWAVTYTSPLAGRWSGTPLGIPLHPVQAYAALAYLTLAVFLLVWLPGRRRQGDVAGMGVIGIGVTIFLTELGRDSEGRGVVLGGALDGPQIAAIALVLAGAFVLMERKRSDGVPLFSQDLREAGRSTSHLSAEPTVGNIGEDPRKP
jgi:phosphatidylglycerol:prolipoprotein diacylglycerol transferase